MLACVEEGLAVFTTQSSTCGGFLEWLGVEWQWKRVVKWAKLEEGFDRPGRETLTLGAISCQSASTAFLSLQKQLVLWHLFLPVSKEQWILFWKSCSKHVHQSVIFCSVLSVFRKKQTNKQTKSNPRVLLRRESCAACEDLKLGSRNYTKSGVVITSVSPMCDYSSFCPFSGFIHIAPAKTYCVLCIFPPICYKLM